MGTNRIDDIFISVCLLIRPQHYVQPTTCIAVKAQMNVRVRRSSNQDVHQNWLKWHERSLCNKGQTFKSRVISVQKYIVI